MRFYLVLLMAFMPDIFYSQSTINGSGARFYKNEGTYIGDFVNGLRHGNGKMTYLNNSVYTGSWQNDKREGLGIFTFLDSSIFKGSFTSNIGNGERKYAEGINIKGTLSAANVFSEDLIAFGNMTALLKNSTGLITNMSYLHDGEFKNRTINSCFVAISSDVILVKFLDIPPGHPEFVKLDLVFRGTTYSNRTFRRLTPDNSQLVLYKLVVENVLDKNVQFLKLSPVVIAEKFPLAFREVFLISGVDYKVVKGSLLPDGNRLNWASQVFNTTGSPGPAFNRNGEFLGMVYKERDNVYAIEQSFIYKLVINSIIGN